MNALAFVLMLAQAAASPDATASPEATPEDDSFSLEVCVTAKDAEGTAIPGATLILMASDGSAAAVTAGSDGCARMKEIPAGRYKITVVAPGSKPVDTTADIPPEGGVRKRVALEVLSAAGEEMVIEARREQVGETRRVIEPREAAIVPGSQGDALKAIQNLPGLARVPFGGAALLVRGGAPEDSRVFLDGQEIPQLYHFGGLTSVVATDMLQSIDFLPGGFGVRYGRATAGVVDVETRGGRADRWGGLLDADVYDSEVVAQGPVGRDAKNGRLMMAGRRSYIDFILPAVIPADTLSFTVAPRYYDYQIRYDAPARENGSQVRVLAYGADDALTFVIKKPIDDSATIRGQFLFRTLFHRVQAAWIRPLSGGWVFTAAPGAGFQDIIVDAAGIFALDAFRPDLTVRTEARGPVAPNAKLLLGFEARGEQNRYTVSYPDDLGNDGPPSGTSEERRVRATDDYLSGFGALYAEGEIAFGQVTLVPGLRLDGYLPASQISADPRVAVRWKANDRVSTKAYAGIYHQPPQFQEWDGKVGNPDLRPPWALQTGVGGAYQIDDLLRVEGEVFHKWIDDLVTTVPSDPTDPSTRSSYSNQAIGRAYGLELLLRRDAGARVYGWFAYTLSRSERADPYTRGGWRPFSFDQTHILTLVAGWRLPHGWEAGARFRYTTGNPDTSVIGAIYDADRDVYIPIPGEENHARVPSFNQLDLRVDKTWKFSRWSLTTYVDVQNVYVRQNPEGVRYDFRYKEKFFITGLPLIPSLGVKGEF